MRFALISALLLGSAVSLHHSDLPVVASSAKPAGKRPQEPRTSRSSERLPLAAVRAPNLPRGERAVQKQQAEPPAPWKALSECEAGGNWQANTGNGFYGGLQFTLSTWRSFGGHGWPQDASPAEQIAVARRVLAAQGWNAWPTCSRLIGVAS